MVIIPRTRKDFIKETLKKYITYPRIISLITTTTLIVILWYIVPWILMILEKLTTLLREVTSGTTSPEFKLLFLILSFWITCKMIEILIILLDKLGKWLLSFKN